MICYGEPTNHWFTDSKEEAYFMYEIMFKYLNNPYAKIIIGEWKDNDFFPLNEVSFLKKR